MKINCAIIDDEPLARKGLSEYVHDVDFLQLEGVYEDALKAGPAITSHKIELIFLDIQMPRISGIDFLKTLAHPPLVILTTAYPQFALEGYELNVLDYLVKPISFPRFLKAVVKAKEQLELKQHEQPAPDVKDDYIFIKADNKLVKIFFKNILYVEALQKLCVRSHRQTKNILHISLSKASKKISRMIFSLKCINHT
jgi:DNA-binding LytR/AlgR family response regulator